MGAKFMAKDLAPIDLVDSSIVTALKNIKSGCYFNEKEILSDGK